MTLWRCVWPVSHAVWDTRLGTTRVDRERGRVACRSAPSVDRTLHAEAPVVLCFAFRGALSGAFSDIEAPAEALDSSGGIKDALRAGIERMALGADINA